MRKLKLDEVIQMEEGEIIPAVSGIVDRIEEIYHGTSKKDGQPFQVQKLEIKDGTLRMKVKVWGRDEIPMSVRGKLLTFISSQTKRGLQGVKISLSTDRGETVKVIHVTGSAEIIDGAGQWEANEPQTPPPTTQEEFDRRKAERRQQQPPQNRQAANKPLSREFDGGPGDPSDPSDQGTHHQTPPKPAAQPPQASSEPGPWYGAPKDWKKFDNHALKLFRLMQRSIMMTNATAAWSEENGMPLTDEHFQSIQAQYFIEMNRKQLNDLIPNVDPASK